jgi:hypothetical protein
MIKGLKTHTVCIEGPDLSGKTTLYRDLHKKSGFRWNVQDRSEVSMLCFSRFYNRDDQDRWQNSLKERLKDMNHRYVLMLPDMDLLKARYLARGDEVHTLETLYATYKLFEEEFMLLNGHPNVLLLRVTDKNQDSLTDAVYNWLNDAEHENLIQLSDRIAIASAFCDNEILGLHAQYNLDAEYTDADSAVMLYEPEAVYYQGIRDDYMRKVAKEISGENEYRFTQDPQTTRRFVYTHDSCISMINCLIRAETLNVFVVLRSSNTADTLSYDLRFLANLISEFESFVDVKIDQRVMNVTIHSAHVIN